MKLISINSSYTEEEEQIETFKDYMNLMAEYWSTRFSVKLVVGRTVENLIENLISEGYTKKEIKEKNFNMGVVDSIDVFEVTDYSDNVVGYYAKILNKGD